MLFFLLINVEMPTIVGILTFMKMSGSAQLSMIFFTTRSQINQNRPRVYKTF